LNAGCYSQKGPVNIHQKRSSVRHDKLEEIAEHGVKLVRHVVSGDFFKDDILDVPFVEYVIRFHIEHPDIQGWGYTHRWTAFNEAGFSPDKMPPNLTILASCDSVTEARLAVRAGWRTARVAAKWEERLAAEARCRYQLDGTVCSECELCWKPDKRVKGILFKRH